MTGAPRPARHIVGFHLDDAQDWVADLECGHSVHMRHNPPWQNRPWVLTEEGRAERIGMAVDCLRCAQS